MESLSDLTQDAGSGPTLGPSQQGPRPCQEGLHSIFHVMGDRGIPELRAGMCFPSGTESMLLLCAKQ